MLALITALVRYAVTVLRTPPSVMSLLCTVAFVPSSNVMSATDQSSTSSTAVRWCGVLPAMPGSFVSCATSARMERARIGRPPRVDEILRVAEDDPRPGHRLQHGVGIAERGVEHARAVDVGRAEEARERLLDDHVLAGARGGNGDLVVAVGRRAHIH